MREEKKAQHNNSLMHMLKNTENKINDIVDRGQKELEERRMARG